MKQQLQEQFARLDPVRLLRDIRSAQQVISEISVHGSLRTPSNPGTDLTAFLASLGTAWKDGEVRPTHRKPSGSPRWWKTRADPFGDAWPLVESWLIDEPTTTAKDLLLRLAELLPDVYAGEAQLRTLQRRVKTWRAERAKDLILGKLRFTTKVTVGATVDSLIDHEYMGSTEGLRRPGRGLEDGEEKLNSRGTRYENDNPSR